MVNDLTLTANAEGTLVTLKNARGQRVAKTNLLDAGDFTTLGVPVLVKMPVNVVRSLIRGRGARFSTVKA